MPTAEPLVGRDAELARVAEALARAQDGNAQVVWLEGEGGSGKTSLLQQALGLFRSATRDGHASVWQVSGDASEEVVEHGISDDLLRLSVPPGDPARAETDQSATPHWRAAELLDRVMRVCRSGTLLLVIDDLHWCDHSSRQTVRFVLRRIAGLRVLVLLAHRPMGPWPHEVRQAASQVAMQVLHVGGLSVAGVRAVAAAHGIPLTPRAGKRLHDHTRGNPQLVVTLAEELDHDQLTANEGPLPAPRSFAEWVGHTFEAAETTVRAVVAAVAVLGEPAAMTEVSTLTGLDRPQEAIDKAVALRLLRPVARGEERLVDVHHALVRSAVNQSMAFTEAAAFHERAAQLVRDPLRVMQHRLQACASFDPDLADEAMALAEQQAACDAWLASARLLIMAGRVLRPGPRRHDLWVTAADRLLRIGEVRWAEKVLADVAGGRHQDPTAHELLVRGHLALQLGRPMDAAAAARRAWELGEDPRIVTGAAELQAYLGLDAGDAESAVAWAQRAIEAADTRLASLQLAGVVLVSGWALRGDPRPARSVLESHLTRLTGTSSEPDLRLGLALEGLWRGDFTAAASQLERLRSPLSRGSTALRATARLARAELDFRRGRWTDVMESTASELALVDEGWDTRTGPMTLAVGAYVYASRGDATAATHCVTRAEALLEDTGNVPARIMLAVARGRVAVARGDHAAVVAQLEPLHRDPRSRVVPEGVHAWRADLAEALVGCGRLDDAAQIIGDQASVEHDPHALCGILRARAAMEAAHGALDAAEAALERAVRLDAAGPFVHARAQLALGSLLRRRGRRSAAAELLRAADAGFAELGATPFQVQARRELESCGLRRDPATRAGALTPAETTVAQLARAGQTNREISQTLTISIKTVETHLGRIYAKLQVRHRVELVAALEKHDRHH